MTGLWEQVCARLNGYEGRMCDFLPQFLGIGSQSLGIGSQSLGIGSQSLGKGSPVGGVFVKGDVQTKEYTDGSELARIPFEVRLRMSPRSVRDRLRVLSSLEGMGRYLARTDCRASLEEGALLKIAAEGMPKRVLAADGGEEEYSMDFYVIVMRKGEVIPDGLQN